MMNFQGFKMILHENVLSFFYFPFWWYTKGLKKAFNDMIRRMNSGFRRTALLVWIKNWLKPMYAQYDWQSRIISFLMRTFQIVFRSIWLILWILFCVFLFLLWIVAPVYVVYQIIFQII